MSFEPHEHAILRAGRRMSTEREKLIEMEAREKRALSQISMPNGAMPPPAAIATVQRKPPTQPLEKLKQTPKADLTDEELLRLQNVEQRTRPSMIQPTQQQPSWLQCVAACLPPQAPPEEKVDRRGFMRGSSPNCRRAWTERASGASPQCQRAWGTERKESSPARSSGSRPMRA